MKRTELLNTLKTVTPGLAAKDRIEHAQSFVFTGDAVLTYNDEVSVRHPLQGFPLKGAIRAEPLLAFLSRAAGDEVAIEEGEKDGAPQAVFKCGRSRVGIPF